jgi:hypothetical protein
MEKLPLLLRLVLKSLTFASGVTASSMYRGLLVSVVGAALGGKGTWARVPRQAILL